MQTLLEDRAAGLMHALVYYGFIVLFLGTVTLEIDHLLPENLKFLEGGFYQGYSFTLDLASVAYLGGLAVFVYLSGHLYFSLKDPQAQVRCAMFRNRNQRARFTPGNGDALRLLGEIRRVLRPEGVARIVVPSLEHALAIVRGEARETFPREFEDPMAQALNYLFCDGQHRYGYCYRLLADFAEQAPAEGHRGQRGAVDQ